jgi:hypothetical protein
VKDLGDAYEKAAEREESELRVRLGLAEARIADLERLVPRSARH